MTDKEAFLYIFMLNLAGAETFYSSVKAQHYYFLYSEFTRKQKDKKESSNFIPRRYLYNFMPSKNGVFSYTMKEKLKNHPLIDYHCRYSTDFYFCSGDEVKINDTVKKWEKGIIMFLDQLVECTWEDIVISVYRKNPLMGIYGDLIVNYLLPLSLADKVRGTKEFYKSKNDDYPKDYYCSDKSIEEFMVYLITNNIDEVVDKRDKNKICHKYGFSRRKVLQQMLNKIGVSLSDNEYTTHETKREIFLHYRQEKI